MNSTIETPPSLHQSDKLPAFAAYLLKNRLDEFAEKQIRWFQRLNLLFVKTATDLSKEEQLRMSKEMITHLLQPISQKEASELKQADILNQELKELSTSNYVLDSEDQPLICHIHKRLMFDFIPDYTTKIQEVVELSEEIDFFFSQAAITRNDFNQRRIKPLESEKKENHTAKRSLDEGHNAAPETAISMDASEMSELFFKLKKSEQLYRQTEKIANMGNWSWDIVTGKLEWTDQLYRIYGLQPQSEEITIERFLSFVHPVEREVIKRSIANLNFDNSADYVFRIITTDGTVKWLHSIAQVFRNEKGDVVSIIGTEQDVTEKQKLIASFEESQRLYKQAQQLSKLGNFSWSLETGKVFWSDEVYRIYDRQLGEPIVFEDAFIPIIDAHKEIVQKAIETTINLKEGQSVSYAIKLKDSAIKYVSLHTYVMLSPSGELTCILGTAQDVTEKEELIEQLKQSEKLYIQAQSLTKMGNWTFDLATKTTTWSDELFDIYELPKGYPLNQDEWLEFVDPSEKERLFTALEESVSGKKPMDLFHKLILANGKTKMVHRKGEIVYNNEGKAVKLVGTTQDVTDQHEALETIKEQQHFIQQVADASPTILYLFDVLDQSINYINHEVFFVLGYTPEKIVESGKNITATLYYAEDIKELPGRTESNKTFHHQNNMIQYECRMKHKDGDYRWLLVREIIFKSDRNGKPLQIIGAALDITHRKEMEKTILQNTLQLEQSNASLEEFAYVASHDLKEPLRKISSFGERLMASQLNNLTEDGKQYLRKIVDAAQRMQSMISDLLSISLISSSQDFKLTSLQTILDETLQTLEFKIEQQKAVIRYKPLPEIKIIPSQFRQLFQNLIANSLKFVRDGIQPVISISCKEIEGDDVEYLQLSKAPRYVKLVFRDNGIGFENEYAQKIFAIFQRLHGRSEYEGSGIGLAICKKIVEHHKGVIFATGQLNEGATFTVILPA